MLCSKRKFLSLHVQTNKAPKQKMDSLPTNREPNMGVQTFDGQKNAQPLKGVPILAKTIFTRIEICNRKLYLLLEADFFIFANSLP